ncbi:MAG TPA: GNAT family N-acetyltransferase [Thermoleophilaceae bacterium]|nr:GNAT family N-acetyltransferase [Thermoleophilaceae bacterium]
MGTDASIGSLGCRRIDPQPIDPQEDPRWERFVDEHPEALVYHRAAWSRILARAYRFQPHHLALEAPDGSLRGVLPLMGKRGPLTGGRMRSLPAIEVGGPLAIDAEAERALVAAACDSARELGRPLTIDSTRPALDRHADGLHPVPRPPTWVAELPTGDDTFESWLRERSSNLRRGVKRARSRGVAVRLADGEDDLSAFYALYLRTMRKHRSLPRSLRQLRLSRELLGPECFRLFLAEQDGQAVAGGVFLQFHDTLELLYNASDDGALDLRPNHALYAHVTGWAAHEGLTRLDYGYAWPGTPLAAFKAQWGAAEEPRYRYASPARSAPPEAVPADGASAEANDASLRERAVALLWDRAPLPLTRLAGTAAYRYL